MRLLVRPHWVEPDVMKRWGLLTAGLYAAALVLLTIPVIEAAFPNVTRPELAYSWWGYWVWLAFMTLCAVLLIVAPVRIADKRDRSRRPLAITVAVAGFLLTMLVFGAIASIGEVLGGLNAFNGLAPDGATFLVRLGAATMVLWALWAAVLYWLTRHQTPRSAVRWWARSIFAGSVLELLVAVPSHIVVRHRDECCAGFYTFIGLVTGISVMLLSFGPGVFFLFSEPMSRITHPASSASHEET
jgi:hypothetical protein